MAITASMVKEIREKTGAGMMDCKKALTEVDGDMEKAVDLLREKGLAKAAKKSGRVAAEGLVEISISEDGSKAAVVEVNSETDFVAKNDEFKGFVKDIADIVLNSNVSTVEELLAEKYLGQEETVQEVLNAKIATIGENMNIRRFERFEEEGCKAVGYIHGAGKIGVLVKLETEASADEVMDMGRDVAMQIAAMNPKYISSDDVDPEYVEHEKQILMQQALNEGKPAAIVEKMVVGRLQKQLKEVCLLDQAFVKDGDLTVAKYIDAEAKKIGKAIKVTDKVRFSVGEGIEKKEENFAEEVAKQIGR
ncbi:elongation factor Ts [Peptoclostridium litorale DSM 5388]|uniref:Elongation factor Ts n=1 Tax=Peptoclostridium litorale DSM 5388 TaxID=1121324 RepID=A0A069REJ3_PEPLI|nr:translation elongation factor Ts [Peptoclostridium litorale]KDR95193.1 elongation factor Ts [Peptoclostridium litorale DSM 5388]SIN73565.1 elongation factor Ts [Peptoclostridium litorale DSM 5388]